MDESRASSGSRQNAAVSAAARRLGELLAPVARRIRIARALGVLRGALGVVWLGVVVGVVARVAFHASPVPFVGLGFAGFVLTLFVSAARRVDDDEAAARADVSHGLDDRLRSAVDLARNTNPTDFESAAIEDAVRRAKLDASRAVPYVVPRRVRAITAAVAITSIGLFLPIATRATEPLASGRPATRAVIDQDTLEASRADLERLRRASRGRAVEPDLAALEAVLEAIERGTIDAEEAFRRLDEIGRRVAMEPRADARSSALAHAASALGDRSARLEATLDAMREGDPERAAQAIAALAEAMRAGGVDRRELERLRESFERMAESARERSERRDELLRRREELRRELERDEEPSLLERHRRELERLERELEELEEQRRELERLERELDEAAEDLNRNDSSSAAEDLEDAFEDLNRMAREQMDERSRQELQQQLDQLREAMRRQRQSGGESSEQSSGGGSSGMQRFRLRAGGSGGGRRVVIVGPGQPGGGGGGEQGQGEGQGSGSQPGGSGSQPGQGSGSSSGGSGGEGGQQPGAGGQGGEGSDTTVLELRPGGEGGNAILELPNGGRPGSGRGPGSGPGRDADGAGTDHDPQTLDSASDLDSSGETSHVEGERGSGDTRSQVIRGAASSGFAGRGYRAVHSDYSDHAEEVLDRENVPPGYQYYVRRYFQMIRPREETNP